MRSNRINNTNKIMENTNFLLIILIVTIGSITSLPSTNWWKLGSGKFNFLRHSSYMMLGANSQDHKTTPCKNLTVLSPAQETYCRRFVDHMPSVGRGAEIGMQECKRQFKNNRWNCSTIKETLSDYGILPNSASKESAFTHAVSSAGVVYTVGKDCRLGKLTNCGCSEKGRPTNLDNKWHWGGCGDNIEYGYSFAKGFVDSPELEKNYARRSDDLARTLMNLHNNEAGRLELKKNPKTACKCHGLSGSCAVRTCWTQLKKFRIVGSRLRQHYNKAIRVKFNEQGTKLINYRTGRRIKKRRLIYIDKSPSYCERDPDKGSIGTSGRQCNIDVPKKSAMSCALMCCGRGHVRIYKRVNERCNCAFQWCCSVKCDICTRDVIIHVCK